MSLQDFVAICYNFGMSLKEGHELYKLYKYDKVGPPDVSDESFTKLLKKGLYVNGKASPELYKAFADAEQDWKDGSEYEKTVKLHDEQLRITSSVKRRKEMHIPELDEIINSLQTVLFNVEHEKKDAERFETVVEFMNGNRRLARYYFIWLYLFPTTGGKNEGWNRLFHVKYDGVVLRYHIKNNLTRFKTNARKYDMRMYILGTYLFIKNHIIDGKCYIPKMDNFKKVDEQWYNIAVDTIDELGKNLISIFDRPNTGSYESSSSSVAGNLV